MKLWLGLGIGLLLSACSLLPTENGLIEDIGALRDEVGEMEKVTLENLGPAPELENDVWLNVDEPPSFGQSARECGSDRYVDLWLNQLPARDSLVEGLAQCLR